MGSKFISTSDGDLRAISDGTLDIMGASLGSQNLTPGFPIKIDSERKLYSTALAIADVVNLQAELDATIQTPFSGTLEATDFKTASGTFNDIVSQTASLKSKTQNMFQLPSGSTSTQVEGLINVVDRPGDFSITPGSISASGTVSAPYLEATTNLTAPTATIVGTVNAGDLSTTSGTFNDIVSQTASLKSKTQNMFQLPSGSTSTQVEGLINVVDRPGDFSITPGSISASGTVNAPYLEATTNLTAPTATIVGTVNAGDLSTASGTFNDVASRTTTLEEKTETISISQLIPFTTQIEGNLILLEAIGDTYPLGQLNCGGIQTFDTITANGQIVVQDGPYVNGSISAPKITVSDTLTVTGELQVSNINNLTAVGGKYSQTGPDITITDTTAITSIINTGQGNLSWSGNEFQAGDNYHTRFSGTIETEGKSEELQLVISLGGTIIHSTTYMELDEIKSTFPWELEMDWTFRSVGATAELRSNGQFTYNSSDGQNDFRGWSSNDSATIDTTGPLSLTATAQWETGQNNNTVVVKQFLLTKTY
jgi:hypothetical protein